MGWIWPGQAAGDVLRREAVGAAHRGPAPGRCLDRCLMLPRSAPDNQFRMSILERLEQMERRMAEMTGSQQHKQGGSGGGGGGSAGGTGGGTGGSQAQVGAPGHRLSRGCASVGPGGGRLGGWGALHHTACFCCCRGPSWRRRKAGGFYVFKAPEREAALGVGLSRVGSRSPRRCC